MPLADKMRPKKIEDMVGQRHIIGKGKVLNKIIENKSIPNMILYGPPGTGKTTLANIVANTTGKKYVKLNAVNCGVKEIKEIIDENKRDLFSYNGIVLMLDEIQALNKKHENIIDSLKKCVDAFKGNLNWKMFKDPLSRKGNYLITISELEVLHRECCAGRVQYNQIDFWGAEKYKKYCDDAIQDIPMLEKHIEETL